MTENEANLLVSLSKHNSSMYGYELSKTEINMILKLFDDVKELEQYRAIGTVEEIQSKLEAYREIGTMEELKALKEKNVAKKPIDKLMYLECPSCGDVGIEDCGYCSCCGQKLDWSN